VDLKVFKSLLRPLSRVTRLGEFSPIVSLFSLGSFFEKFRSRLLIFSTVSHGKSCGLILAKNAWAVFWASFSQTHLVTLTFFQTIL
jgi:hypothetical protein